MANLSVFDTVPALRLSHIVGSLSHKANRYGAVDTHGNGEDLGPRRNNSIKSCQLQLMRSSISPYGVSAQTSAELLPSEFRVTPKACFH